MGELLALAQLKVYAFGFTLLFLIYFIFSKFQAQKKVDALGARAPRLQSWLPFGLKFIFRGAYDNIYHRDLETWMGWFKPHGPSCMTVETNLLGLPTLLTHDPENIKATLATQFEDYGKGSGFHDDWEPFLGDSIFTTDGELWRDSRRLIRPQFIKERVSDLSIFETHVQVLFDCIDKVGNGAEVNMNDLFLRFTLDSATEFLLGKSVDSLQNPFTNFSKAFSEVQRVQNNIGRSGPANVLLSRTSYNAAIVTIDDFVNPFVEEALKPATKETQTGPNEKYTFLNSLAEFTQDRKVLRDQIVATLLAGRDTTGALLSWTFYELSRNPKVVEKLRREIMDVVGMSQRPTYQNLKSMKYLQNILNETLRLYPAVPINVRSALKDTTLPRGGGTDGSLPIGVLKDSLVVYAPLALHRLPEYFPNPLKFDPDRWNGKAPIPWAYIPFNGGPRICVGQQFALAELGYTITRILQRYERVEDRMDSHRRDQELEDWNLKAEIVLQPMEGVKVGLWRA